MATHCRTKSIERRAHPGVEGVDPQGRGYREEGGRSGRGVRSGLTSSGATGLASRVHDAGDTSAFLITDICNALPRPVRELIQNELRATYGELVAAVLVLETGELKEAAADFARDEENCAPRPRTCFSNQSHP